MMEASVWTYGALADLKWVPPKDKSNALPLCHTQSPCADKACTVNMKTHKICFM